MGASGCIIKRKRPLLGANERLEKWSRFILHPAGDVVIAISLTFAVEASSV